MTWNILVTMPGGDVFDSFFDEDRVKELKSLGMVEWNETGRQYSAKELGEKLQGKDICITGWGCEVFDESVLARADRLKLIAHTGGSVKPYVTDGVYEKGIRVVSGNQVFAESVAESVVAYALSSLRDIPRYSEALKKGCWPDRFDNKGLLDRTVGIVGYGMIAKYVVGMLKPFHNRVKVFSRHISDEELKRQNMESAELKELFSTCDIISVHSAMTRDNYHLITEELLRSMKTGALLINTPRGAVIDEPALVRILQDGDIHAVLDVYETEPLPKAHPLMACNRAILMPHMGGPTMDRRAAVTKAVTADIRAFMEGRELDCEIDREYAKKMSAY